jgi:small subunit ribosomal protein S6
MPYELLYIIPTPYTEDDLPNIQKNVNQVIDEAGVKITKEENLGNKRLAYDIKKVKRGYYLLVNLDGTADAILKIEQKLKLMPEVLRLQIIKLEISKKKAKPRRFAARAKTTPAKESAEKVNLEDLGKEIDKLLEI